MIEVPLPVGVPVVVWIEISQAVSVLPAVHAKDAPEVVIEETTKADGETHWGKTVKLIVTTESQPLTAAPAHTLVNVPLVLYT